MDPQSSTLIQPSVLIRLPQELLEQTIIACASHGSPTSISSLAQTCRFFTQLIYRTPDNHLWREIFLTTFDDPRPVLAALYEATPEGPPLRSTLLAKGIFGFEWQEEFTERIKAKAYIRRHTQGAYVGSDIQASSSDECLSLNKPSFSSEPLLRAMQALVSVMHTAAPMPEVLTFAEEERAPPFPHLVLLQSTGQLPAALKSLNAQWLQDVLKDGYPVALTRMMFLRFGPRLSHSLSTRASASENEADDAASAVSATTTSAVGTTDGLESSRQSHWARWEGSLEGQLFYKLVTMSSFLPNPSGMLRAISETSPSSSLVASDGQSVLDAMLSSPSTSPARRTRSRTKADSQDQTVPPATLQIAEARTRARAVVYDVSYLRSERCWGPFLPMSPVEPDLPSPGPRSPAISPISSPANDTSSSTNQLFGIDLDDDGDGDFTPSGASSDFDSSDDEDTPHILFGLNVNSIIQMPEQPNSTYIFPSRPDLLKPDYAFLAAARLLVEENIRELMLSNDDEDEDDEHIRSGEAASVVDALHSLEHSRMGGAPRFWRDSWVNPKTKKMAGEGSEDGHKVNGFGESLKSFDTPVKGKGKEKEEVKQEEVEGWDWAGVEGEWRRCVCWMDYRDLVLHNLSAFSRRVEETMRIFPVSLRVTHYSPPPPCPPEADPDDLVWRLPIIHIAGEGRGSDIHPEANRKVRGTVRMMGDGAVRWSMTSSYPEAEEDEWVTESVQIGGIGSAIGFVGLWTGAEHARADPLGPCWAWKVS